MLASTFTQQLPPQSGITQVKVRTLTDEGTYIVQSGDALWTLANKFNKDMYELARLNDIPIVKRPDGSEFALMEVGKVLVVNASTSLKFVTAYEYASIRSMYDDDSAVGSLVNVVTQGEYNDWKRSQALSASNLFGQPAMQPLAPLSLISGDVQSAINDIHSSMTAMGLTDSMQLSALPSSGTISPLTHELATANSCPVTRGLQRAA